MPTSVCQFIRLLITLVTRIPFTFHSRRVSSDPVRLTPIANPFVTPSGDILSGPLSDIRNTDQLFKDEGSYPYLTRNDHLVTPSDGCRLFTRIPIQSVPASGLS